MAIVTLTLNPCIDRFLWVENFVPDDANRVEEERHYAAGKGVDVSRAVTELGGESLAMGFVGGFDGLELVGRLINAGVQTAFDRIAGETRVNVHVVNKATGQTTSFNARGPEVQPVELGQLAAHLRNLNPCPEYFVMSGSVPVGVTKTIYAQFGRWMKERGCKVVLDADGSAFREGLKCGPFMVKPNLHELGRFVGEDLSGATYDVIADKAQVMVEQGVEYVFVSMGARGVVVVSKEARFFVSAPKVTVQSTIGSGDSFVAGVVYGLSQGKSIEDAAKLGSACGAATAMTPGTELFHKSDVERLLTDVRLEAF